MVKIIQALHKTIITSVFVMKQREDMISQFKFITSLFLLDKKTLGENHPSVAETYNNLGIVQKLSGNL